MNKYYLSFVDKDNEYCGKVCEDLQEAIQYVRNIRVEAIIYRLESPLYCHYVDNKIFID